MKIDLHIHSKEGSDGCMTLEEIFKVAIQRNIGLISITDHDSIDCQEQAKTLADQSSILYLSGLELNVTFSHPGIRHSKPVSLDFLAFQYDILNQPLVHKLSELRGYRRKRADQILGKINQELAKENFDEFTPHDLEEIQDSVAGAFGRPHIANYMIKKGIVTSKQEAFDKYLEKCNVPKMPLSLPEASRLVRGAGGKLILAHPNDLNGGSLVSLDPSLEEQKKIIKKAMLSYIDGIECWHPRHDRKTVKSYLRFAREEGLMVTGGTDCHQQPLIMGALDLPPYVAEQFGFDRE